MQDAGRVDYIATNRKLRRYVAGKKISALAGWLYETLLQFHNSKRGDDDVWPSRKTLATECGLEKPESVDRLLRQLVEAGLILIGERRSANGGQMSNRYTLLLIERVQPAAFSEHGTTPTPSAGEGGTPSAGYELKELEPQELKNLKDGSEALAPLPAPDSTPSSPISKPKVSRPKNVRPKGATPKASTPKTSKPKFSTTTEQSERDRELFVQTVEEHVLYSDGSWLPDDDFHAIDEVYDQLRSRASKAIRLPGRYVEEIGLRGEDAVSHWLASQGLCRPSWMFADMD